MDASDGQKSLWVDLPLRPRGGSDRETRRSTAVSTALSPEIVAALRNPGGVLFLDVETTGLSLHYDQVTLVGYDIGKRFEAYVAGDAPDTLLRTIASAEVLVTFNGKLFDVPFLRKAFGAVRRNR